MKSFFKYLYEVAESVGRARAAAHYSRMGRNDLARQIMLRD
jgi:hypothetical protein